MEFAGRAFLVTGGAGFIGSNLVRELISRGARWVGVIDDFSCGSFENLLGLDRRVDVYPQSLLEFDFAELAQKPLCIFHLAAITDTTVEDQARMLSVNLTASRRLLSFAAREEIGVVYASSAAVYGKLERTMKEEDAGHPANIYGFSKLALDWLAGELIERERLPFLAGLRFFNVYGPGEAHKGKFASMIYQLACHMREGRRPRIFKFGEQKRDFVFVDDAVEACLLAAAQEISGIFNVGTGRARSFNDVVAALNRALGTSLEPDYFDNPYAFYQEFTEADLTRTREALGFEPRYGLEEGVAEYMRRLGWAGGG